MDNKFYQFPLLNIFKMKRLRNDKHESSTSRSALTIPNQTDDNNSRRFSMSHKYYTASSPDMPVAPAPDQPYAKQYSTKQSQTVPPWIVGFIALGLGVHPRYRPILGTIIHVTCFTSALVYIVTFFWVRTYDVMSPNTPLDILQGSTTILIALIWACLGMYAKSLAKRLFKHSRFIKDIRMHSRTVFKINAAFLTFLLGLVFVITNDVESTTYIDPHSCQLIELPVFVCWMYFVSKVVFSIFSLIWNTLIAIVLISICRTHTIGLRRFIKELEEDALLCDNTNCKQYQECPMTKEDICEETFWLEEDQSVEENNFLIVTQKHRENKVLNTANGNGKSNMNSFSEDMLDRTSPSPKQKTKRKKLRLVFKDDLPDTESEEIMNINVISTSNVMPEIVNSSHPEFEEITIEESNSVGDQYDISQSESCQQIFPSCSSDQDSNLQSVPEASMDSTKTPVTDVPRTKLMSTEEILHKYWKISCRLRASSCAFQRWLATLITLIIIWCIIFLLHWQYNPANIGDIIQFVIPLLILPLICSCFAEVNLEGVRMVKCIFPINERLQLLRFLQMNPLQMTLFNVNLSYGTILTVVFAIFVAFTSRLIFTELQKN